MANTTTDLLRMMINVSQSFSGLFALAEAIFALIGLLLFGIGLFDLYKWGSENNRGGAPKTGTSIAWRFVIAVVLTSLSFFIDVSQNTLGAPACGGYMCYQAGGASDFQKQAWAAVAGFLAFIGYIAFGRGWLLLDKHFNGGREGVAAPIWHIIAGTMLIFLDFWSEVFKNTTGFEVGKLLF